MLLVNHFTLLVSNSCTLFRHINILVGGNRTARGKATTFLKCLHTTYHKMFKSAILSVLEVVSSKLRNDIEDGKKLTDTMFSIKCQREPARTGTLIANVSYVCTAVLATKHSGTLGLN